MRCYNLTFFEVGWSPPKPSPAGLGKEKMKLATIALATISGATLLIAANGMAQGPRSTAAKPYQWDYRDAGYGLQDVKKAAERLPDFYEHDIVHTGTREIADLANNHGLSPIFSYTAYGPWEALESKQNGWIRHRAMMASDLPVHKGNAWAEAFYDNDAEPVKATYRGNWGGWWFKDWGRQNTRAIGTVNGTIQLDAYLGAGEKSHVSGFASGSGESTVYRKRGNFSESDIVKQSGIEGVDIKFKRTSINPDGSWAQTGVVRLHPGTKVSDWGGSWGGRFSGEDYHGHNHDNDHGNEFVLVPESGSGTEETAPPEGLIIQDEQILSYEELMAGLDDIEHDEHEEIDVPEMAGGAFGAWIKRRGTGTEIGVLGAFKAAHDD